MTTACCTGRWCPARSALSRCWEPWSSPEPAAPRPPPASAARSERGPRAASWRAGPWLGASGSPVVSQSRPLRASRRRRYRSQRTRRVPPARSARQSPSRCPVGDRACRGLPARPRTNSAGQHLWRHAPSPACRPHSRALYLPTLALPPVTRSMVAIGPLIGWPQVRLRPCGWRLRPMLASIGYGARGAAIDCAPGHWRSARWMSPKLGPSLTCCGGCSGWPRPDGDPVTGERFCEAALLLSLHARGAAGTGLRPEQIALRVGHLVESRRLALPSIATDVSLPGVISPSGLLDGAATHAEASLRTRNFADWLRAPGRCRVSGRGTVCRRCGVYSIHGPAADRPDSGNTPGPV
jgi:hypothetical protein